MNTVQPHEPGAEEFRLNRILSMPRGDIPAYAHVHDYDMIFKDNSSSLNYRLECSCGDVAPNMEEALVRMRNSRIRAGLRPVIGVTVLVVGLVLFCVAVGSLLWS